MKNLTLKQKLINTIANITGNGSFYSYGKMDFIIPRMKVGSDLEISLPLQSNSAKELINYAVQAPYGKGNETLVDTKVRKTWEIDGSEVTFGNPSWNKLLDNIIDKVKEDFSLQDVGVEPHLYKLLIYEKGGFFLKHKDTEKHKGMFASLVINLPSEFTGGELEIEWNGKSKKIDFSEHIYDIAFAAFYTDCDHEVHPIKSGYRISLVYNLVKINNGVQLGLATLPKAIDDISEIFLKLKESKIDKPFLFLLEHQYTPTNFAINALKDHDINRSQAILQAAKKTDFFVDLGLLTHHIDGAVDYDQYGNYNYMEDIDAEDVTMSEILDEYIIIGDWVESYYPSIKNLKLEEVEILNNRNYQDLEEAISSYAEGYMGNYGPSVEYDYHIGAILIMPFNFVSNLIKDASRPVLLGWIEYFLNNSIESVDLNKLVDQFLDAESGGDYWANNDLDILVDCLKQNVVKSKRQILLSFLGKHLYALSTKKAVILFELLENQELSNILICAINTDKLENFLAILKPFLLLTSNIKKDSSNILLNHSELIFTNTSLLFRDSEAFYYLNAGYSKDNDKIVANILKTLIKISDHLAINNYLEPILSTKVDRKFIHEFLSPILKKDPSNRNNLWKLYYKIAIDNLKLNTEVKPQKPSNWKREFNFTGNMTDHLEMLKKFLLDPEREALIYIRGQRYRSDMEYLVTRHKMDISCITVKKGSPHQLHLIKNLNSYKIKLKAYEMDTQLLEVLNLIK